MGLLGLRIETAGSDFALVWVCICELCGYAASFKGKRFTYLYRGDLLLLVERLLYECVSIRAIMSQRVELTA